MNKLKNFYAMCSIYCRVVVCLPTRASSHSLSVYCHLVENCVLTNVRPTIDWAKKLPMGLCNLSYGHLKNKK